MGGTLGGMAPSSSRRNAPRSERRQAALHHRRQQATARTAAARRAARHRRQVKGGALFVVVAVMGGLAASVILRGGGEPSKELRAKTVSGASGRLGIASVPAAYHAIYRAEAYEGSAITLSTEEVFVQRPFNGSVAIREGEPPGTTAQFQGRSNFGVYANFSKAAAAQIAGDAPTVALGDVRVTAFLDELIDQGLFVQGDRRKALNRECQTYRTGSPLQSLKITAPTPSDYVDVCLDATGLIVEEMAVVANLVTQRLIATSLDADPPIDPATFAIDGPRLGADQGGAEVTEVDRAVAPTAGYWALDASPAGFTHRGRYLVAGQGSSYVDVYVRGVDIVSVRQGAVAGEPDLSDAGPGTDVDLTTLGAGKMLLRTVGPTLIAHPSTETFVHVNGTLSPADLKAIAGALGKS